MNNPTRLTASRLRANVSRILDQVVETGVPAEIERHGRRLRITLASTERSRGARTLARLKSRPYLRCQPEALVHLDWSRKWRR